MKYTPLMFGDGRGSVGGLVFSRNTYGSYIRKRVNPVNPSSSRQQAVRNLLTTLVELWNSTLTQAQRDAWNLYGKEVVLPGLFGDIHLTGFAHYIRSNVPILQVGGTRVDDGPTEMILPGADPTFAVAITESPQQVAVTFDNTLDWANEDTGHLAVSMSMPRPPSREFIGSPYRYMDVVDGNSITPPTSPANMTPPWAVSTGQKVECFARILRADGRVSVPFRVTVSVTAGT